MSVQTRPSLFSRMFRWSAVERQQRAAWIDDEGNWQHNDLLGGVGVNAAMRRANRSNGDLTATYAAVYAAVRKRSQAMANAEIVLMRGTGPNAVEVENHPALDALRRVNESLTFRQGLALIEQHKLTWGKAYWIKRRNRLGVPVEFEIWQPDEVEVAAREDKPWVPLEFRRHTSKGTVIRVDPKDVIWFRHMVDPRNSLNGLSPIGAVRVELDTGMEAQRFNQRFFDNSTHMGDLYTMEDAGPGEIARMEQEMERKYKGTDNAHRARILGQKMTVVEQTVSHRDMQFLEQMQWSAVEVARVFELNVALLADNSQATKENLGGFLADFWQMMVNQAENTIEEMNEFYIRPDFGEDLRLVAKFEGIPALQPDKLTEANVDKIRLDSGVIVINEVRDREGMDAVPWGDVPIVPNTMAPLDTRSPAERDAAKAAAAPQFGPANMPSDMPADMNPPRMLYARNLEEAEADARASWERRLSKERRAILAAVDANWGRKRAVEDLLAGYDWDWWDRYARQVIIELGLIYETALDEANFMPTPLMPTHELAVRYAQKRAAELLELDGRENVVKATREAVRAQIADTLETGGSLRDLKNNLRQDFAFSDSRADMIARTETAQAQGRASVQSYQSNGYDGKQWLAVADSCEICAGNEGDGAIPLTASFSSGDDAPPAHPRCRCTTTPVVELPRRTVRTLSVMQTAGRRASSRRCQLPFSERVRLKALQAAVGGANMLGLLSGATEVSDANYRRQPVRMVLDEDGAMVNDAEVRFPPFAQDQPTIDGFVLFDPDGEAVREAIARPKAPEMGEQSVWPAGALAVRLEG